jgi:hypothetical protein
MVQRKRPGKNVANNVIFQENIVVISTFRKEKTYSGWALYNLALGYGDGSEHTPCKTPLRLLLKKL